MATHHIRYPVALAPPHGRRRLIRLLVLGAALIAMMLVAAGSVAANPEGRTVHVIGHSTSFKSTQANQNALAPGDEFFIGGTVLRPASPHSQIGTYGVHCVATGAGGSQILCDAAYVLPAGEVTLEVLLAAQPPTSFKAAITGGTGAYRNATGQATIVTLSQTDEDVTFRFGGDD